LHITGRPLPLLHQLPKGTLSARTQKNDNQWFQKSHTAPIHTQNFQK